MKVVILAGGYGSRLTEETKYKPKPLVEIGGVPILYHIMQIYIKNGMFFLSFYFVLTFIVTCGQIAAEYYNTKSQELEYLKSTNIPLGIFKDSNYKSKYININKAISIVDNIIDISDVVDDATAEIKLELADGFTEEWLDGRTLYSVILDTEDDDNDSSTTDNLLLALKYEDGNRLIDFAADGIFEVPNETYEIVNGVLKITNQDGDFEDMTITAIDETKITSLDINSWSPISEIVYDFFELPDAQAYLNAGKDFI